VIFMIDLAPQHKIGLTLANPIMIGCGFAGYGKAYQPLLDLSVFGAIVTNPITLRPEHGTAPPRVAETPGGFILNNGAQNPGVRKIIQQNQNFWARLTVPLIAHLPAEDPADLERTARALANITTPQGHAIVAAIELGLPADALPFEVTAWLKAIHTDCPLPVLVKLPLGAPPEVVEAAAVTASALVIATPPLGTAVSATGELVTGYLYGSALLSLVLHDLHLIRQMVNLPLIAAGGIHTMADVQMFLAHGATAVQLDSLLFVDPKQAEELGKTLRNE